MPRGDKTGPNGMGAKTGRSLGYCVGNNRAGFENEMAAYGRGNGLGRRNRQGEIGFGGRQGQGFRHGFYSSNQSPFVELKEKTLIENEINNLKDQLESLESRLKTIRDE